MKYKGLKLKLKPKKEEWLVVRLSIDSCISTEFYYCYYYYYYYYNPW